MNKDIEETVYKNKITIAGKVVREFYNKLPEDVLFGYEGELGLFQKV